MYASTAWRCSLCTPHKVSSACTGSAVQRYCDVLVNTFGAVVCYSFSLVNCIWQRLPPFMSERTGECKLRRRGASPAWWGLNACLSLHCSSSHALHVKRLQTHCYCACLLLSSPICTSIAYLRTTTHTHTHTHTHTGVATGDREHNS